LLAIQDYKIQKLFCQAATPVKSCEAGNSARRNYLTGSEWSRIKGSISRCLRRESANEKWASSVILRGLPRGTFIRWRYSGF